MFRAIVAIPVENPPPPYAPAARRPPTGAPAEPLEELLRVPPAGARVYRAQIGWRGCLVAIALTLGLLFAVGGFGTCAMSDEILVTLPARVSGELRTTARAQGRETAFDEDLRRFEAIVAGRRLTLVAAVVLLNRYSDVKADSQITEAELDRMMEVVRDVALGNGEINPERYPDGR